MSCCAELGAAAGASAGGGDAGIAPLPNIISTGTFFVAFAGMTSAIWISTLIAGYDELSTCPISCFAITGTPAIDVVTVCFSSHFTAGTMRGTRPKTSRSNSSTISGRRCFHHVSALATVRPFFSVSGSGRSG